MDSQKPTTAVARAARNLGGFGERFPPRSPARIRSVQGRLGGKLGRHAEPREEVVVRAESHHPDATRPTLMRSDACGGEQDDENVWQLERDESWHGMIQWAECFVFYISFYGYYPGWYYLHELEDGTGSILGHSSTPPVVPPRLCGPSRPVPPKRNEGTTGGLGFRTPPILGPRVP